MGRRRWYDFRVDGMHVRTSLPPPDGLVDGMNTTDIMGLDEDTQRHQTAVHEVAHAAVARSVGMHVLHVSTGDVSHEGFTLRGKFEASPRGTAWPDVAAALAAGERGAARWTAEQGLATAARRWAIETTSAMDRLSAEGYAAASGAPGAITYGERAELGTYDWSELRQNADEILDGQWPAVLRAADALYDQGRLTGDDLDDLLGGA